MMKARKRQEKNKKMGKIKFVLVILMVAFLGVGQAKAQQESADENITAVVLANVEIYDAKIVSQEGNKMKIAFDIYNDERVQPGIKYGIYLAKSDGEINTIIDAKTYDEKITVGAGETVHREIDYSAPSYLSGNYVVWVVSENGEGLPLGQESAGNVNLSGNSQFLNVDASSCYLKIDGQDGKRYFLGQGVDITASESLVLVCDVKNNMSSSLAATPILRTYSRSIFGNLLSSEKGNALEFSLGEKKSIEIALPKMTKPEAYDVELNIFDSNNNPVSNQIISHYVLSGLGANIQNVSLDKNSYVAGDLARVSFSWSGSADNFPGSRNGGTKLDGVTVELSLTDVSGKLCSEQFKKELSQLSSNSQSASADIKIASDCNAPSLTAIIRDAKGNILDKNMISLAGSQSSQGKEVKEIPTLESKDVFLDYLFANNKILIGILPLIILLVGLIWWKRKGGVNKISIFLLILLGGCLWGSQSQAKTVSVCTTLGDGRPECAVYFTTSLKNYTEIVVDLSTGKKKRVYLADSKIIVSAKGGFYSCDNNTAYLNLTARINKNIQNIFVNYPVRGNGETPIVEREFKAQSVAGEYDAVFAGTGDFEGRHYAGTFKIPYIVKDVSEECVPDTTCNSHVITWNDCSGCGTQTGTCEDGCGGKGDALRPCPSCCICSPSEDALHCSGPYINNCGASCDGNKKCSEGENEDWKEVAP